VHDFVEKRMNVLLEVSVCVAAANHPVPRRVLILPGMRLLLVVLMPTREGSKEAKDPGGREPAHV